MQDHQTKSAPMPTVRRLPSYLRFLKLLQTQNREYVSCTHIAAELDLDPTQIRKDLSSAGAHGTPKIGYQVDTLVATIESFLGWDDPTYAFLVGANGVAETLVESPDMQQRCGLDVVAVFDTDAEKVGSEIAGKEILAVEKLPDLANKMHVHIGIIAVPGPQAQEMANALIASGVKAIWNFTNEKIDVPEGVSIENLDIAASMAALSAKRAISELVNS